MSNKTRPAAKARVDVENSRDGWYEGDPTALSEQLKGWMNDVPDTVDGSSVPVASARVIIAPHAGYRFSGPCAAWAYKTLDLSRAKRVFVLGPNHVRARQGGAVSGVAKYATPFGDLTVDQETIREFKEAADLGSLSYEEEVREHSLEMHMPYLHLRCQETFGSPDSFPTIVPVIIGSNSRADEKEIGEALVPYLRDPENAFIVSSDFCHWGEWFDYMVYSPTNDPAKLERLHSGSSRPKGPPIHETIRLIDEAAMEAVKSGSHDAFVDNLKLTKNTVCGRHPIGVMMAALEELSQEPEFSGKGKFSVIQYQRSEMVQRPDQTSVSYVSAYAVV